LLEEIRLHLFLSLRSKTAHQLRLIECADAPVTAGSPRCRARPFFRSFIFVASLQNRSPASLKCALVLLYQRTRRVVGRALAFDPLLPLRSKTAQQLRLMERADAPVPADSHPIQAKTPLDGGPGSPRGRARPFFRGIGQILLTFIYKLQVTAGRRSGELSRQCGPCCAKA
jgi:hypothetical protein